MPEIPENVNTDPVVPPSTVITGCQVGAYESFVQLESGEVISVSKFLADRAVLDASGELFDTFVIENTYGSTGTGSPAAEGWLKDANPLYYRALFLPSLTDLGVDSNKYKIEARPAVVVNDALSTGDPVDIRLIDMVNDSEIAGAGATANMPGDGTETVVYGNWVEVRTNACLFVDARKRDVNGALVVSFRRQVLHVRIVRR